MALLEALVALAMIGGIGLGVVAALQQAAMAERVARDRERLLAAAHRVLGAASLLRRPELDQRLGRHGVGEFVLSVQRPEQALYRLAVAARENPGQDLLVTVVYRPLSSTLP